MNFVFGIIVLVIKLTKDAYSTLGISSGVLFLESQQVQSDFLKDLWRKPAVHFMLLLHILDVAQHLQLGLVAQRVLIGGLRLSLHLMALGVGDFVLELLQSHRIVLGIGNHLPWKADALS